MAQTTTVILTGPDNVEVTLSGVGSVELRGENSHPQEFFLESQIDLQEKSVTPATTLIEVTPDPGYDGLSKVNVNAMPNGTAGIPIATKGTPENGSIEIVPSVTNIAGYVPSETKTGTPVTVSASELVGGTQYITTTSPYDVTTKRYAQISDVDLISSNIKSGVNILGIEGTFVGIDTSDATAKPNTILYPYTAYSRGNKITGNIVTKNATNYYPSRIDQTIDAGYYLGGIQTIKAVTTNNITTNNIRKDITVQVGDVDRPGYIISVTGTLAPSPDWTVDGEVSNWDYAYFNMNFPWTVVLPTLTYETFDDFSFCVIGRCINNPLNVVIAQNIGVGNYVVVFIDLINENAVPIYATQGGIVFIPDSQISYSFVQGWNTVVLQMPQGGDKIEMEVPNVDNNLILSGTSVAFGNYIVTPTNILTITSLGIFNVENYKTVIVQDINLIPENIKKGVTIFGVTGTYEPQPQPPTGENVTVEGNDLVFDGNTSVTNNVLILDSDATVEGNTLIFE